MNPVNNSGVSHEVWKSGGLGKNAGSPEVVFSQVHEDAAIELELLRTLPHGEKVFCIASGGCTALALLLAHPETVYAVDINPAQIYFLELKKAALSRLHPVDLMACLLQDARPFYAGLRAEISGPARGYWDKREKQLSLGLNTCGLIEQRMRQVRTLMPLVQSRRNVRRMYSSRSLREQRYLYKKHWNHWRWRLAFRIVMSRPLLGIAYGKEFVREVPPRFDRIMYRRIGDAFTRFPIEENGYLSQLLRGRYPREQAGWPLYLQQANFPTLRASLHKLHPLWADAATWLEEQPPQSLGFFALSNILEVASPEYARRLMRAVARAAKPGAKVCLRAIFPFRHAVPEGFLALPTREWEEKDRSFFCGNLRILERREFTLM